MGSRVSAAAAALRLSGTGLASPWADDAHTPRDNRHGVDTQAEPSAALPRHRSPVDQVRPQRPRARFRSGRAGTGRHDHASGGERARSLRAQARRRNPRETDEARQARNGHAREERRHTLVDDKPTELANDLEAMGTTFVKIGQLLSTRPDLLPAQ